MNSARLPTRRGFLKTAGSLVAVLPLAQLTGCADDSAAPAPPAADRSPSASTVAPPPAPAAPGSATANPAAPIRLEESDTMAQALGYRHVAASVDATDYPRFQPGHACANCSLYQAEASDDAAWGGCSIFPGRLVDARGWCNAYVPVA